MRERGRDGEEGGLSEGIDVHDDFMITCLWTDVLVPAPTVTIANSGGMYYLGQSAEFTCSAGIIAELDRGDIIGRFTWLLNGTELVSDGQYQITTVGDLMSRLTVLSLSLVEDTITCSATIFSDVNINIESQPGSDSLSLSSGCELHTLSKSQGGRHREGRGAPAPSLFT